MKREIDIKEIEDMNKDILKDIIFPDYCQWIREKVPEYKLEETKKFLSEYDNYFDPGRDGMIERVYRGIKNSIKIEYAYWDAITFLSYLIYLFSDNESPDSKTVEEDLLKLVNEESFLIKFYNETKNIRQKIEKKGHYYICDKVTLTYLGSNVMFYYILISIVNVTERALEDNRYKFEGILDWQEEISLYIISEIRSKWMKIKGL